MEFILFLVLLFLASALILLGISNKYSMLVFIGFGIMFILGISLYASGITMYVTDVHVTKVGSDFDINNFQKKLTIDKTTDDAVLLFQNLLIYGSLIGLAISIAFTKINQNETILDYARRRLG